MIIVKIFLSIFLSSNRVLIFILLIIAFILVIVLILVSRWINIIEFWLLKLILIVHGHHSLIILRIHVILHTIIIHLLLCIRILIIPMVIISLCSSVLFSLIHVLKISENGLIFWSFFKYL